MTTTTNELPHNPATALGRMQGWEHVKKVLGNDMNDAMARFRKTPTSSAWRGCMRAMLVYQQFHQLAKTPGHLACLAVIPMGDWGGWIVREVTGQPLDKLVNDVC